jgi:phosphatidylserine/phosphatidylglycerophosphate/cardiolipin synthase-like enzyme
LVVGAAASHSRPVVPRRSPAAARLLLLGTLTLGALGATLGLGCGGGGTGGPDGGGGGDGGGSGCDPLAPRAAAPEAFVGPSGLETRIGQFIDGAQHTLDVQMYLFTVTGLSTKIVNAKGRGVAVRVLLDPTEPGNTSTKAKLAAAGVPVKDTPAGFSFSHAKYLIADGTAVVIMSSNLNIGAMNSERNYGVIDRDAADIADVQAIFNQDWGGAAADLSCTRLLVSPVNSASRTIALINAAKTSLDLEVLYLSDTSTQGAVTSAKGRGVNVRLILSDPATTPANTATITYFKGMGIPVKVATAFDLHAKLIISDGVALVGSENMSYTSFQKNREVSALVFEPAPLAIIKAQFDSDWSTTVAQ